MPVKSAVLASQRLTSLVGEVGHDCDVSETPEIALEHSTNLHFNEGDLRLFFIINEDRHGDTFSAASLLTLMPRRVNDDCALLS